MKRLNNTLTLSATDLANHLACRHLTNLELEEKHGISAEVIDPRTLRPLDLDTILDSVRKTSRAVIVEEGWPHGGVGANLSTLITEQAFDWLDAPVQRVTGADVPMPYSRRMEQAAIPHEENVIQAVLAATEGALPGTADKPGQGGN